MCTYQHVTCVHREKRDVCEHAERVAGDFFLSFLCVLSSQHADEEGAAVATVYYRSLVLTRGNLAVSCDVCSHHRLRGHDHHQQQQRSILCPPSGPRQRAAAGGEAVEYVRVRSRDNRMVVACQGIVRGLIDTAVILGLCV